MRSMQLMGVAAVGNKYIILARSLLVAVALAFAGGYLNELGVRWFPRYEKYVDNVVAMIIIIPMIYLVFVPAFKALAPEKSKHD